ncbi:hypothetical protein ACIBO9_50000 [Streptomyces prunicolor]
MYAFGDSRSNRTGLTATASDAPCDTAATTTTDQTDYIYDSATG